MMNSEFHNGLRNPGLYSLISHKSAAADEKRTLVGNDTTRGLTIDSPAKSKTGKTEFTVAGILRDAELSMAIDRKYIKTNKNESFRNE
jgi:hypothetical protein